MAGEAAALSFDDRLSAGSGADLDRPCRRIEARPNERDDAGHLRWRQRNRRHPGAWDAVGNDLRQVLVGVGAAELAATEIDTGHLIAVRTMALRALRVVEARADVDVRLTVLAGMILRELRAALPGKEHEPQHARDDEKRPPMGHDELVPEGHYRCPAMAAGFRR